MRKTLLLLCALLATVGAWAETINLGNSSNVKANATFYKNESIQGSGVWCDKAVQSYITLTGSISSYSGYIEVVKNGTTSLTISVPSFMSITGYSLGLKTKPSGTNTCTANNGGSGITLNESTATTVSESSLNTHSVTINFTGTGDNNGECLLEFSDFTVEVEGEDMFVSDASQLSNTKVYAITTARGAWTLNTGGTVLSSTHKKTTVDYDTEYDDADQTAAAQEFAIYKQGDYYYIYSLKAEKFVVYSNTNSGAPLYDYATIPYKVLTSNNSSFPLIISTWDERNYANNNNGGGIAINSWKNQDSGNRLAIAETRDLTSAEITTINNALADSPLLDRHKVFTVTANRGTWCANAAGTSLATTSTNTSPASGYNQFAVMFYDDNFYLYNVGTKTFIKNDGSLNADSGDPISIRCSGDATRPYMFFFPDGGIYFNMQNGGGSYAMNTYNTPDDGNKQSLTIADATCYAEMLAKFELAPALAAITEGSYHITTTQNGVKYYVTSAGKLSTCVADGTTFAITKDTEGSIGTGIRIDSGSERFTNPTLSNNHANLSQNFYAHSTGDRSNFERQVFFLNNEGKFAIRSCNTNSGTSSWDDAGRTFWTYSVAEAGLTPCYSYDPAYVWELEEPGTSRDFTFNFYYGGNKVHEETISMEDGSQSTVPASLNRDYCTYTYTPVTVSSSATSVDVTTTWSGPFELSADFATAHWYDMAVRGDYYVTSDRVDGDNALAPIEANAMGLAEDAYQWAFIGDPWHIKLYNKDKGNSKVYSWSSTGNGSIPAFVDVAEGNSWWIRQNTTGTNTFQLTIPEYGYQVNQFGGATGSLKIWADTRQNDVGSAFKVIEVPDDFAEFAAAEIQPYANATGYFAFTDAVKSSIGWQDSYATECPFATYKSMKETLMAIDMTDLSNFVLPETGYYTLKNKMYNTYMGMKTTGGVTLYGDLADSSSATSIVKLTKDGNTYSISLMDKYAPSSVTQSNTVYLGDNVLFYTPKVSTPGYAAFQADTEEEMSCLHRRSEGDIVGWRASADASQWTLEDASSFKITIGNAGYSTLWVPFAVTIPDNVEIYTGTINGSALHLNEVEGETLHANTAVVLKGEANTYTFNITTGGTAIEDNVLLGSKGDVTSDGTNNIYALAQKSNVVGFYPVGNSEHTVTIPAGKAYLEYTGGSNGVKGFTFVFDDDDPTGISNLNVNDNLNEAIYNLAGQRLNKMQKGINIVNGKKILK